LIATNEQQTRELCPKNNLASQPPDIKFRIYPRDLLAMRLLQSKDETRFVLNGVHFEIHPNGKVLLIATNGRYLGILKPSVILEDPVESRIEFTVDYPLVKYLPKPKGATDFERILMWYDGPNQKVHFISEGECVTCEEVLGVFPKWRQVIPTSGFAPFEVHVNSTYVSTFEKVAKMLDSDVPLVSLMGHKLGKCEGVSPLAPYSVFLGELREREFYGVIMPVRTDPIQMPDWLQDDPPAPAPQPEPVPPTRVLQPGTKGKYGKIFIGTSAAPPEGIGSSFLKKEGFSYWIEWGRWYEAPTVDPSKFGAHDYEPGIGSCKCGCHMGDSNSSGPVDPFGACPCNPLPPPASVVGATAQPAVPHPIIPPSTKTTKAKARKERKHVHKRNTRPRKNLDRLRRDRHAKKRKGLHVQR